MRTIKTGMDDFMGDKLINKNRIIIKVKEY
jgi:hypothetical protein